MGDHATKDRGDDPDVRAMTVVPGEKGTAGVKDVPEPDKREGAVLVRGIALGICGTDREIADGAYGTRPPGETTLGDPGGITGLLPGVRVMVLGAGQTGCGYESQLESWYRFLVDPDPYQSISIDVNGLAAPTGVARAP